MAQRGRGDAAALFRMLQQRAHSKRTLTSNTHQAPLVSLLLVSWYYFTVFVQTEWEEGEHHPHAKPRHILQTF